MRSMDRMGHVGFASVVGGLALVGGCQIGPPTHVVPLAELDAEMQLGPDSRILSEHNTLRLHEPANGGDHCRVLSPRDTRATLDGVRGEIEPGGPATRSGALQCLDSALWWDDAPSKDGPSTFEITDGTATWTFVIWQPFEYREFEVTSHPDDLVRVGDTVTLKMSPPGTLSNAQIVARAGATDLFVVDESSGVTRVGDELSFVMPEIAVGTEVMLQPNAELQLRIDRCDAPRGCRSIYGVNDTVFVTIAP
ncbi:MAG: hypothetical protein AB7O24_07015 [Kofleriaceae bacterium]